jgi:ABC-type sugar transport system ATPase subunit
MTSSSNPSETSQSQVESFESEPDHLTTCQSEIECGVVLSLDKIDKRFPGVHALKQVSFEVRRGQIHGLVGENGAGKSTLISIAAGSVLADAGTITINGQTIARPSPGTVRSLGLAVVYQKPALIPDLNVQDNLLLGVSVRRRPTFKTLPRWCQACLRWWPSGDKLDAATPVRELEPGKRFVIEIAKAIAEEPTVLILDEPTEHLSREDRDALFGKIRELAARGCAVVYISHRIREVMAIADDVTILRDGSIQGTFPSGQVSEDDIINLIVGRQFEMMFPPKNSYCWSEEPIFECRKLSGVGFTDFNLAVNPGEIIGLAGIQGQGQRGILRSIAGLQRSSGDIEIDGKRIRHRSSAAAGSAGIVYIPAERHSEGLMTSLGVRENLTLTTLNQYSHAGLLIGASERASAHKIIEQLHIRPASLETNTETLSGGNQQKVVLGRVLMKRGVRIILADELTQGVDVGARSEIGQCPNITAMYYANANGDPQQYASDFSSMVAQGVNAIVTNDNFGVAQLGTLRKAYRSGVAVVANDFSPGGTAGQDYTDAILENNAATGSQFATWLNEALKGTGNTVMLGGPAGDPLSTSILDSYMQTAKQYKGLYLLSSQPLTTSWTVAGEQQATSGFLSKYADVNGVMTDYLATLGSVIRAYQAAGRPLGAFAGAASSNEVGCLWDQYHSAYPNFQVFWLEGSTNLITVALRKAVAAAEGLVDNEPTIVDLTGGANTLKGKNPPCDPSLPPDASLGSTLTHAQLKTLFASK